MKRLSFLRWSLLLLLLLPPSCVVNLVSLEVPKAVFPGELFQVSVVARWSKGTGGSQAGAVLQLPKGFTVFNYWSDGGRVKRDDPAVLGLYQPEPGFYLASFSGSSSQHMPNPITLRILVRAPKSTGAWPIKVALAGQESSGWQAQDPKGARSFSKITGAPYAARVTVTPNLPSSDFRPFYEGLPWLDGSNWSGVAWGDVDHDGRDDLACVARLGNGPHVYRSVGRTFSGGPLDPNGGSGRSDVAFGDFNADGNLDVACANGTCWLGDGKGGFKKAVRGISLKGAMEGVAVGDVNHDGYDDVIFTGHLTDYTQCFLSDGKGGWKESSKGLPNTSGGMNGGGHKCMLFDVNGDGNLDLVWTKYMAPDVWAGDGKGNWKAMNAGLPKAQFWGVTAGDMDGDGKKEIVFGSYQQGTGMLGGGVRIYRWDKTKNALVEVTGTGLPTQNLDTLDVAVADFDGDGNLDVAFSAYQGRTLRNGILVYRGNGKGKFSKWNPAGLFPSGANRYIEGLEAGDMDGDGWPDLAAAFYAQGVCVFHNEHTGFRTFGEACAGSLPAAPAQGFTGSPAVGSTNSAWTLSKAPANAPYILVFGLSRSRLAGGFLLPYSLASLGAPGCFLRVAPILFFSGKAGPSGSGAFRFPIPNQGALHGALLYSQFLVTAPGANPMGLVLTEGGALRIR